MRNAHYKFDAESQSQSEVEKALGTANHEKTQPCGEHKAQPKPLLPLPSGTGTYYGRL